MLSCVNVPLTVELLEYEVVNHQTSNKVQNINTADI